MNFTFRFISYSLLIILLNACNGSQEAENNEAAIAAPSALQYEIVKVYPHDTSAYTQGLEWDGNKLIEGTGLEGKSILHILDTNQKQIGSKIKLSKVFNNFGYVNNINELEYVNGKLYANIYGRNSIVVINLNSGLVIHTIDFSNLLAQSGVKYDPLIVDAGYVLNGIAYQPKSNTFFITGKCWPVLVEMKIK